jgi:hypothetical protein
MKLHGEFSEGRRESRCVESSVTEEERREEDKEGARRDGLRVKYERLFVSHT